MTPYYKTITIYLHIIILILIFSSLLKIISPMKTICLITTSLLLMIGCQQPAYNIFNGKIEYVTSFPKTDTLQGDTIYTEKLNSTKTFQWNTFGSLNRDKQKYATAMQFFNQINIYQLNGKKATTIIPSTKATRLKEVEETPMPKK